MSSATALTAIRNEAPAREESVDAHREAAPAVVVVILLQLTLASVSRVEDWSLWVVPWWAWLVCVVPEIVLLVPRCSTTGFARGSTARDGGTKRRSRSSALTNALLLVAVLALPSRGPRAKRRPAPVEGAHALGDEHDHFRALVLELRPGRSSTQAATRSTAAGLPLPALSDPGVAAAGWQARVFDYLYVAFTNSIAFSPTDTLPLTSAAKRLMLAEPTVSAVTVLPIAARSVNIFR